MSTPTYEAPWVPKYNPWLIGVVVVLAAFMEVLDTSIANVALPYIAGGLGVSNDDSTWVLTSYLASNAIVLPVSGWFAGRFGRKRFFIACLLIFTASSLLCGMAPSLGLLLVCRAIQGAGGGGLQPTAQAILADTFPPEKRGLAFALYGVVVVLAPTVGPTLGGWITFSYSWRWIFFINLPVGPATVFEPPPSCRDQTGLHRSCPAGSGDWRFTDIAGQGAGRRLVRFAIHRNPHHHIQHVLAFAGGLGVVPQGADH